MVKIKINDSVTFKHVISCLLTIIALYHSIHLVVEACRGKVNGIGAIIKAVGILRTADVVENL